MGITIHYAFFRRNAPEPLMQEVAKEAVKQGMKIVTRTKNRLCIEPHPHSEWIDLHWKTWKAIKDGVPQYLDDADQWEWIKSVVERYYAKLVREDDWVCIGFTKTEFAGVDCHCAVAELLRLVGSRCRLSGIGDEAGYYELGRAGYGRAKHAFDASSKAISLLAAQLRKQCGAENVRCGQDIVHNNKEVET